MNTSTTSAQTVTLVDTPEALAQTCERVARAPRVALDTEFHTEKSYTPHLMVVQLLFDDGVALVDPLALRDLRPLVDALAGALTASPPAAVGARASRADAGCGAGNGCDVSPWIFGRGRIRAPRDNPT